MIRAQVSAIFQYQTALCTPDSVYLTLHSWLNGVRDSFKLDYAIRCPPPNPARKKEKKETKAAFAFALNNISSGVLKQIVQGSGWSSKHGSAICSASVESNLFQLPPAEYILFGLRKRGTSLQTVAFSGVRVLSPSQPSQGRMLEADSSWIGWHVVPAALPSIAHWKILSKAAVFVPRPRHTGHA